MRLRFWLLFLVVQSVGFFLPSLANFHRNVMPLIFGMILLLPGSILAFVLPRLAWGLYPAIIGLNAGTWYLVQRLGGNEFLRG